MAENLAFLPIPNATAVLAADVASARVAITNAPQYRIWNAGAGPAFVEFGDVTVVAVLATSMPIPPGAVEVFRAMNRSSTHVAAIAASAIGSIYITSGEGF